MSFDNIKIYMQNGKLTDLEINYYINKGYVTTNS